MASARIDLDLKPLQKKVRDIGPKLDRAIFAAFEYQRAPAESYMRINAPWTDRTGNARSGLFATTTHAPKQHEMIVAHSMPYGIYLETRFSGRYAIIEKTVVHMSDVIMKSLEGAFAEATR